MRSSIWSCSGWGLPCHRCHHRRGALLPHLFTLTSRPHGRTPRRWRDPHPADARRFVFCGTFRGLTPPRRYLAPCPWSPDFPPPRVEAATARSTPAAHSVTRERHVSSARPCRSDTHRRLAPGPAIRERTRTVRRAGVTGADPVRAPPHPIRAGSDHARVRRPIRVTRGPGPPPAPGPGDTARSAARR